VMGAFRTGKSFLMDLFLRYLRYDEKVKKAAERSGMCPPSARSAEGYQRGREDGEEFPVPPWIHAAGLILEGASDSNVDGFRFRGGMDTCTEGIWVWSEPFIRKVHGRSVAVLLMDTQGAWDGSMTKQQSATIFGLTAALSSKLVYNISTKIEECNVTNLAFFMEFARAALWQATSEAQAASPNGDAGTNGVERENGHHDPQGTPFQSLEFLVRDWRYFEDEWSVEECRRQMAQQLDKHVNPQEAPSSERSVAEALHSMFHNISCFCLPHPGFTIEKKTWTGAVGDIGRDFLCFIDAYAQEVFGSGLAPKKILGAELSTSSFAPILRNFVDAFQDSVPRAAQFTKALVTSTVILAKESALRKYSQSMEASLAASRPPRDYSAFSSEHAKAKLLCEEEYKKMILLAPACMVSETWAEMETEIEEVLRRRLLKECGIVEPAPPPVHPPAAFFPEPRQLRRYVLLGSLPIFAASFVIGSRGLLKSVGSSGWLQLTECWRHASVHVAHSCSAFLRPLRRTAGLALTL